MTSNDRCEEGKEHIFNVTETDQRGNKNKILLLRKIGRKMTNKMN